MSRGRHQASPMFLGDRKAQCQSLTLGNCVNHPYMCTSYEILFDLGCCLVTPKIQESLS